MSSFRLTIARLVGRALPPIIAQRVRVYMYPNSLASADKLHFKARAMTGSFLQGNTADYYYWHFSVHGYYDWRNIAIARALCHLGETIVEVGANVGTETINYSDIVGETGRVIAFEPVPSNVAALKTAIANARYKNVILHQIAVADYEKTVRFAVHGEESGVGFIDSNQSFKGEFIEVQCSKLDSILQQNIVVSGIFIDAEGSDINVLRGAHQTIERYKPFIVLEVSRKALGRAGFGLQDVIDSLPGYKFFRITKLGLRPITELASEPKAANWLCLHESKSQQSYRVANIITWVGLMPFGLGMKWI